MKNSLIVLVMLVSLLAIGTPGCERYLKSRLAVAGQSTPGVLVYAQSAGITEEEKRNLQHLLPQVLLWSYRWKIRIGDNHGSSASQDASYGSEWLAKLKEVENTDLEVNIEETPKQLIAYIADLAVQIRFNRVDGANLSALRPEILTFNSEHAYETLVMRSPSMHDAGRIATKMSSQKSHMLNRIKTLEMEKACFSLSNSSNERIRVTIPDFDVGDPELYVLLQGNRSGASDGKSIDWIRFETRSDGEIIPVLDKNFGLPDEVKSFSPLIERMKYASVDVDCSRISDSR